MAGLNQLDASPVRPPGSVHGDGHSQFGNAASAAADGERERPPTLPPVCLPPLEWLNPRPTKREKGREGAGAAEDLWRNGVCHGRSSSLPLSTLLSSRAITHIFYDIALLPSLSHLRSSRFAVKRDFACRRRRLRLLSPLSSFDAAPPRQTDNGSPPPCRAAGALVSFQTAAAGGLAVITTKLSAWCYLYYYVFFAMQLATLIFSLSQRIIFDSNPRFRQWSHGRLGRRYGDEGRVRDSTLVKK